MKQRWLVVIVGLPALLAVLLACPAWATMLVVCGIAGIAAYELLHTAGENVPANFYWGLVTTVVMQEIWLFKEEMSGTYDLPISTVTIFRWILVMMAFLFAVISYGKEKPFTFHDVAVAIIGGIVFPAMYSCIFLLRSYADFGRVYVLAPFFIAFAGDALSMYFGMWFGKRKMAPAISPGKTWAGAVGAVVFVFAFAIIAAETLPHDMIFTSVVLDKMGYAAGFAAVLLLVAVSIAGDLFESAVKRQAGVKDSSNLLPGHGGFFDRFDSSLAVFPTAAALLAVLTL